MKGVKVRSSLVMVAGFFLAGPVLGDSWFWPPEAAVSPRSPTSSDALTIVLSGDWPDSCVPRGSQRVLDGDEIFVDVIWDYPPGIMCFTMITPWSVTEIVPPLPPGVYRLFARLVGDPLVPSNYTLLDEITVTDYQFALDADSIRIPEGGTAQFTVALFSPKGSVPVTVAVDSGDPDLTVTSGGSLLFDSSTFAQPQTVNLSAAEDEDLLDGSAVITVSAADFLTARLTVVELDNDRPSIRHVDARASGAGTGADWTNAYTDLQKALEFAREYAETIEEIRVAGGTYKPAPAGGDRQASFRLADGVALKGGYAGVRGEDPDVRDPRRHETILSGDLNGDDGANFTGRADNSHHVVDARGLSASTTIEGFTVTAGDGEACSSAIDLMRPGSDATIRNCIIAYNRGVYGGGVRTWDSSPTISGCVFVGNRTTLNSLSDGGGLYVGGTGAATVAGCSFVGNSATEDAGGFLDESPGTRVINCIFWGNRDGGGADESAQVQNLGGEISHSFVQGWTGALGGEGNSGEDPLLGGPGGFHLSPSSPCIDAGLGDAPAFPGETDIDGEARVNGARVDVGADEYHESSRKAFRRGDADCDGEIDIADPIRMLFHLFVGGQALFCERAADSNEDARVDIGDPICVLQALFAGSGPLAGRLWQCEEDPADGLLSCAWYPACD